MKKRVLIFDDDADICNVCSIVLETSGFEVATHDNCNDIVQKVADCRPDVILLDNKIPPTGGIDASRELKASADYQQLPIVFFSANLDIARLAAEAGADFYIEKPFELDHLVLLLRRACNG